MPAIIALLPREPISLAADAPSAMPAGDLHLTLVFLSETALEADEITELVARLSTVEVGSLDLDVMAAGVLGDDEAVVALFDGNAIHELHEDVAEAVADLAPEDRFPSFVPHMTFGYPSSPEEHGQLFDHAAGTVGDSVVFDRMVIMNEGDVVDVHSGKTRQMAASRSAAMTARPGRMVFAAGPDGTAPDAEPPTLLVGLEIDSELPFSGPGLPFMASRPYIALGEIDMRKSDSLDTLVSAIAHLDVTPGEAEVVSALSASRPLRRAVLLDPTNLFAPYDKFKTAIEEAGLKWDDYPLAVQLGTGLEKEDVVALKGTPVHFTKPIIVMEDGATVIAEPNPAYQGETATEPAADGPADFAAPDEPEAVVASPGQFALPDIANPKLKAAFDAEATLDTYTHAGLIVKAVDSGRLLMTQRTPDPSDDAGTYGTWEFPGGGIDDGENVWDGAVREFEQETGLTLPDGWEVVGFVPGAAPTYLGVIIEVPEEGWTTDAELLDVETMGIGWFNPTDLADVAVRDETAQSDWDEIVTPTEFALEFANPWHDESGRFAPKGTGTKHSLAGLDAGARKALDGVAAEVDAIFQNTAGTNGVSLDMAQAEVVSRDKDAVVLATVSNDSGFVGDVEATVTISDDGQTTVDVKTSVRSDGGSPAAGQALNVVGDRLQTRLSEAADSHIDVETRRAGLDQRATSASEVVPKVDAAHKAVKTAIGAGDAARLKSVADGLKLGAGTKERHLKSLDYVKERIAASGHPDSQSLIAQVDKVRADVETTQYAGKATHMDTLEFANPWHDESGRFAPERNRHKIQFWIPGGGSSVDRGRSDGAR